MRVCFVWSIISLMMVIGFVAGADAFAADASDWPSQSVVIKLPSARKGETEQLFNLFKVPFRAQSGDALTFSYFPDLAGAAVWAKVVDDPKDGTVLTVVDLPGILLRTLQPDSGVSPDAMAICHIPAYAPSVLWGTREGSIDNLAGFIMQAQKKPNALLVAGSGRYSAAQLAARMLDREAGIKTTYFPFAQPRDCAAAAVSGRVNAFWGYPLPPALPGVSPNVFKPLAVAALERLTILPDVPTFRETGLDLISGVYWGIAVPVDTPEDVQAGITRFFFHFCPNECFFLQSNGLGDNAVGYFKRTDGAVSEQRRTAHLGPCGRLRNDCSVAAFLCQIHMPPRIHQRMGPSYRLLDERFFLKRRLFCKSGPLYVQNVIKAFCVCPFLACHRVPMKGIPVRQRDKPKQLWKAPSQEKSTEPCAVSRIPMFLGEMGLSNCHVKMVLACVMVATCRKECQAAPCLIFFAPVV